MNIHNNMKKLLTILSAVSICLMAFTACENDEAKINSDFDIDTDEATYDASTDTFHFHGERTTVTINVVTGDANGKWDARCPTNDLWCSFSKEAGKLIVTVAENNTNAVRKSHITIVLGDQKRTVNIEQDFVRNLSFASSQITVGAASSEYKMAISTNVELANIKCVITDTLGNAASENFWISTTSVTDTMLTYSVKKNYSETQIRKAFLILSGDGKADTLTVTQNKASGKPYIVPLSAIDYEFDDCLSYEIWDETNNIKIGNICREYLLKGTSAATTISTVAVVAYPVVNGEPDHTNGYVIATIDPSSGKVTPDGGSVMWNSDITAQTSGSDMLASRQSGTLTSLPSTIYMPLGGNTFTATPLDAEDQSNSVTATLKPWTVTDKREGAEIEGRGTSDEFTYRVVKVGCQYWFADNLKTTRFRDGSPIPTGTENWDSDHLSSGPVCAMAGYTSTGTSFSSSNANSTSAAAVAVRNETGPVYNYFALFNAKNDVTSAFAGSFEDALSPSGWGVPTRAEFTILHNYITQTSQTPESDPSLALVQKTAHETTATNLTGFSATCYRYKSATGTNSSNGIHYAISDAYSFTGTAGAGTASDHATVAFCCGMDTNTCFRTADVRWGIYVRCIKRSQK